jgi:uncharacterized protein (TIGR02597 family)
LNHYHNMKSYLKYLAVLFGAALSASSHLAAESVSTNPVGYVTTTTPTGDDALIGLPLVRSVAFVGIADSVDGAEVAINATLVSGAYDGTHYALATSGANAGQWSEIVATSSGSITTADVLLASTDTFDIIPFWTLSTAFPNGDGVGVSTVATAPVATLLVNNLQAVGTNLSVGAAYFYYSDGTNDGWYDSTTFAPSNDVKLTPDTYLTIRNNTGSSVSTVVTGSVPTSVVGSGIVRRSAGAQDSQMANPYPAPITLGNSGLADAISATTLATSPTDTVLIFDIESTSGQNISVAAAYMYYMDGTNDGWYDTTTFAPSNDVEIPAGGAFIVRTAAGSDEVITWNPPLPYTL